jgi:hypothetical protein
MANYRSDLISELKPIWDNQLRRYPALIVILSGSSLSFFMSEVLRLRSLHNRSDLDLRLDEFPIVDAAEFLHNPSLHTLFDAYLSVGGISVCSNRLTSNSIYQSLCEHSFRKNGFFADEFEKVFVSSFGNHPTYLQIVAWLRLNGQATRD